MAGVEAEVAEEAELGLPVVWRVVPLAAAELRRHLPLEAKGRQLHLEHLHCATAMYFDM